MSNHHEATVRINETKASNMALWKKILIGMLLGALTGSFLGEQAVMLEPIGILFLNLIKMLIVPLVFCSLVVGVSSIKDGKKMGRLGLKSFVLYLLTTAVAITVGLLLASVLQPGRGMDMAAAITAPVMNEPQTLIQSLLNLIPQNPVTALAEGNILQIILFALALGIALSQSGEKGRAAITALESLAEAMYRLTAMVMRLAPFGVFGLIAWVAGKYGFEVLLSLGSVIIAVYIGCLIQVLLVYTGIIGLLARSNPVIYLKAIINPAMVAFSTASSSGTLPVTIRHAQEDLGVSKSVSGFVLPLGATINMDGTALYQGVTALFIAQAFGVSLDMVDYFTIITTATLASIGTAGVPGAGLIMLSLVLTSVGLPMEGLAIIAGVDRILDMARTSVNVCGDMMVSMIVAKSEGELEAPQPVPLSNLQ
ncbi:dicarboxylate/amino acid:cation symporter [Zobellella sp. DQSA1]|uniref:dicarboxylate/amino acid:cation symporter n=1 Tax=Zobellella sp. DQSA1 TaxID=3342386 RepID=UPI0035BF9094